MILFKRQLSFRHSGAFTAISSLIPANTYVRRLLDEGLDLRGFVELTDQLALQIVLDKVDEEMHDGLGHRILRKEPG